jgi:signal transduction histidine kinase
LVRRNLRQLPEPAFNDEPTCAATAVAELAAIVEAMDEPDLALVLEIDPGLPQVMCDPVGLRRALLNLILNARDAMTGKGIVWVKAQSVRGDAMSATAEIRVTDTGIGMSRAVIDRAFDSHFTTRADGLGGIGLSTVRQFVRDACGSVFIESEPGIGTTVILRLPISNTL